MHRLICNLMCNNFACLNRRGIKLTVWRLSFDHRAIEALALVLAQVWIYFDNVADCLKVVAEWLCCFRSLRRTRSDRSRCPSSSDSLCDCEWNRGQTSVNLRQLVEGPRRVHREKKSDSLCHRLCLQTHVDGNTNRFWVWTGIGSGTREWGKPGSEWSGQCRIESSEYEVFWRIKVKLN